MTNDEIKNEIKPRKSDGGIGCIVFAIFIPLVIYVVFPVILVFPIFKIYGSSNLPTFVEKTIMVVFYPIEQLDRNISWYHEWIKWQVELAGIN